MKKTKLTDFNAVLKNTLGNNTRSHLDWLLSRLVKMVKSFNHEHFSGFNLHCQNHIASL